MPAVCASARAYSSSANLGPGFDVLAVAHTSYYDEVTACYNEKGGRAVEVVEVAGPFAEGSGGAASARRAAEELLARLGLGGRVELSVYKGVPPGRGLGSSGASAAAAVAALGSILSQRITRNELVYVAGLGETEAAGTPHFDNVAASLLGGFVLVTTIGNRLIAKQVKPKKPLFFAILVPSEAPRKQKTKFMRSVIPRSVEVSLAARNFGGKTALMVLALLEGDLELLGEIMMSDEVVERARARYINCYWAVREAALSVGALGVSLSGAGPSMIALAWSGTRASMIAKAMLDTYRECGGEAETRIATLAPGALEPVKSTG